MDQQRLRAAERLSRAHAGIDSDVREVYLLEDTEGDEDAKPIKLLEVVDGTIETGVDPVSFPPDPGLGLQFSSLIIEVSPREYESMKANSFAALRQLGWKVTRQLVPSEQAV